MPGRLFVYGTLMFPAVMARVSGRRAAGRPAVLEQYACYRVRGAVYPGIIPVEEACTEGMVYAGLGAAPLARLDRYEGDEYRRERVQVRLHGGRVIEAWTYVMRSTDRLSAEPWDRAQFGRRELAAWLRRIA